MNPFAEFAIFPSRCGLPSAMHVPTDTLIHSRVNPEREAADIADAHSNPAASSTVIIGGGLGYLAEAVSQLRGAGHPVHVIEPHREVLYLARASRGYCAYLTSERIHVHCAVTRTGLSATLRDLPADAAVIVAPYLLRLSEQADFPLGGLLRIVRAEIASSAVYNPLLAAQSGVFDRVLANLPSVFAARLSGSKTSIVAGAGPNLTECLPALAAQRSGITLIAASGAVPALLNARLTPDWVFALEAKDTVIKDLEGLPLGTRVVVFPSTHPAIIGGNRFSLIAGASAGAPGLETRGGSSVIPALDFALCSGSSDVVLIGVDLGNQNGTYAAGSARSNAVSEFRNAEPPKFLSMRAGLERVLHERQHPSRAIYHVLRQGRTLCGTERISPERARVLLHQRSFCEVQGE
ncbi:MAG TPA: 6-hydroxymethylpterin diphosphokinase MptE-like protein [bacterium]|jgi:hypothetical protein